MIFYRTNADWSEVRDVIGSGHVTTTRGSGRALLEEYVHPDDHERVFGALALAVQAGSVFELEHRVRDVGGEPVWAVSRGIPVRGAEGEVSEWFGSVADVTERRRAEAALHEKEARHAFLLQVGDRLRELTEADQIILTAAELLGRHLKVNRVVYGEIDEAVEYTTVRSEWTDGSLPSARGRYRLADFGPEVADAIRRGEIRRSEDTTNADGHRQPGDEVLGVRAALALPMLKGARLVVVMGVHSRQPRRWTDFEVQLVRDVSERIWSAVERARTEAALRASEAKYRTLFEAMDEGFGLLEVVLDESGAPIDTLHVEINPAYTKHTGLSDVVGKRSSELLPGMNPENFGAYLREIFMRVLRTGEPLHLESYFPLLGRWLEVRYLRAGDPARNQIAVLLTDVTLRRQAAEELSRAAERSAFLVQLADALAPLLDPLEIQGAATRIIGQKLGCQRVNYAEVIGNQAVVRRDDASDASASCMGVYELTDCQLFGYAEVAAGRTLVFDDIETDPRLDAGERDALGRNGARAGVSVPLVKEGVLRGLLNVRFAAPHAWTLDEVELVEEAAERTWAALERGRAESALRETEERLRAIVQNVHDYAIFLTDAQGVVTEWPHGAEHILGYTADEAVGQPSSRFYRPEAIAAAEHEAERLEAARAGRAEREGWRVRKDGQQLWVNEISTAVRDAAGTLVGFTKISRDLTEKRRGEQALLQLAEANAYRVELADSLRVVSEPLEIQRVAASVLGRHLGAARVLYAEVIDGLSVVHRDYVDEAPSLAGQRGAAAYPVFFRQESQSGLTTVVDAVEADVRVTAADSAALRALGIGAIVSVPLVKEGELRATFDVHHAQPHAWTASEVQRIEKTAERAWAAVEHARAALLLRESEERFRQAHAELEERVAQRTAELAQTNSALAAEVAQRRSAEEVRSDLLRRLDSAQEDERRRVARDLHDQVGQTLTALTLAVRATREAGAHMPEVSARLTEVQRTAEQLGREVHGLAVRLRPTALDDLGLHAALGQLLSEWSSRTSIEVDCQLEDLEQARLPPDFETMLYRVVQEALTNVARHARAEHASVVVQRVNGAVVAVVEDDGVGFDVSAVSSGRIGLLGLSERVTLAGGALEIESREGKGTTLIARVPYRAS